MPFGWKNSAGTKGLYFLLKSRARSHICRDGINKVKQPRRTRFVADLRLKIEAVYERHFKSFHMEATPLKTAKWTRSNRAVSLTWNVLISIRWKTRQNPTPICTAKGVLGELDIGRKQNGRYPHMATVGPLSIRTSICFHLAKSDCPDQFLTYILNNAVIFGLTSVYVSVLLNEKLGYFARDRSRFVILFISDRGYGQDGYILTKLFIYLLYFLRFYKQRRIWVQIKNAKKSEANIRPSCLKKPRQ